MKGKRMSMGGKNNRKRINLRWISAGLLALLFIILFFSNACTSIVTPPDKVKDPVRVYLLQEARHKGLVLPDEAGGFVEFGYGDWDWFAMMCNSWYHTFDTVLWPTRGCLGRRELANIDDRPFRRGVDMEPVEVEAARVKTLLDDLNRRIEAQKETAVLNREYDFEFVHSDDGFWLFYNCNDSIADWMEALGCEVSWRPVRLGIRVETEEEASEEAPKKIEEEIPGKPTIKSSPRWNERRDERNRMVDFQIRDKGVSDPRVLEALREVPRHLFVPEIARAKAYADHPLHLEKGQTISQPYIVAFMTEHLLIDADDKVLEIGTGSGYQAAILAELVKEVYTIEIIESLGRRAEKLIDDIGYENVHVRIGDGYKGWPEEAPFDAIMVTAAPDHVPKPLIDQLKVGGSLLLPVGRYYQELIRITKTPKGLKEETLLPVRFVPMTGEAQRQD